jgi:hypothetical protein
MGEYYIDLMIRDGEGSPGPSPLLRWTILLGIVCSIFLLPTACDNTKDVRYVSDCPATYTAHDTHVARCYRCALGQYVEKANKDFCERNYGFWDLDKDKVKDSCK